MTAYHALFHLRNQRAFHRLLDTSTGDRANSNSGSKSWNKSPNLASNVEVNSVDWLGRSVLHLACAATDHSGVEYVRMLLAHQSVDVNKCDTESRWTSLHHALYNGNIESALLLLRRPDIDTSIKDFEGYTAFDLYNSTIEGTKPSLSNTNSELYTWGANRNAALGLGDGNDRAHPEKVTIPPRWNPSDVSQGSVDQRLSVIRPLQISMSKLHTSVVTSERGANLYLCGFGNGGRLGPSQHTQYSLTSFSQLTTNVVAIALGQDHSVALSAAGEVLTWGLNRFTQLGYVIDGGGMIQPVPKKVVGALRREIVRGVAASRCASACWTDTEVFSWGTNNGQLGYDRTHPSQVLPRKVTKVTRPVTAIALTDSAMVCLLVTYQVICIWNDRSVKISFPSHTFPNAFSVYRPPQALKDAIVKLVCDSESLFGALSSAGEVFTFSVPPTEGEIKPVRAWTLKQPFSAARDAALGLAGTLVVCTAAGQVYCRSGVGTGKNALRAVRIPYLQRVYQVCANSMGAFGALREDFKPSRIVHGVASLSQDFGSVQPYLSLPPSSDFLRCTTSFDPEDEVDDLALKRDVELLDQIFDVLERDKVYRQGSGMGLFDTMPLSHGADVVISVQGLTIPAHQVVLASRSTVLCTALTSDGNVKGVSGNISLRFSPAVRKYPPSRGTSTLPVLTVGGVTPLSMLILLVYLYTDEVVAVWDTRVISPLSLRLASLRVEPQTVRSELSALASSLVLPLLAQTLTSVTKRVPTPSLVSDLSRLYHGSTEAHKHHPTSPDVVLRLADREVLCHSVVLRARCTFFSDFFGDPTWTENRWEGGLVYVDMRHLKWRSMAFVLRFLCCGEEAEMFENLDFVFSVDDLFEFMFDVISTANELLLEPLILICSEVILKHCNINYAGYILSEATHFHADQLITRLQSYVATNLELMVENNMLEDLTPDLARQLSTFVRLKQEEKSPVTRLNILGNEVLARQADWLALQDFPQPIVRSTRPRNANASRISPTLAAKKTVRSSSSNAPPIRNNDVFSPEEVEVPPLILGAPKVTPDTADVSSKPAPSWKPSSVPRTDMRAIMEETASSSKPSGAGESASTSPGDGSPVKYGQRPPQRERRRPLSSTPEKKDQTQLPVVRPSGSPWKVPVQTLSPNALGLGQSLTASSADRPSTLSSSGPPSKPVVAVPSNGQSRQNVCPTPQGQLGPVFTPRKPQTRTEATAARQASGSNKAWVSPQPAPQTQPQISASSAPGVSLLAIQRAQLEQGIVKLPDRRSLREIQEEERASRTEADFLKWWAAEEERVRFEAEGTKARSKRGQKKSKGSSGSKEAGRMSEAAVDASGV